MELRERLNEMVYELIDKAVGRILESGNVERSIRDASIEITDRFLEHPEIQVLTFDEETENVFSQPLPVAL